MDSEDIRCLTKQKLYIPTSIYELEHHANHGIHFLCIFFGSTSFLIIQLRICQKHIQSNMTTYSDLQRIDPLFVAKVLFIIDLCVQNFFKSAQQGQFNPEPLDFSSMFQDIVQNRTFNARLLDSILSKKRRRDEDHYCGGGHNDNQNTGRPREDKGAWVCNTNMNPEWKIKEGEVFGKLYHTNRHNIPKNNSVPICAKYQIQGWCYENCSNDHNTIERNNPMFKQMSTFY